MLVGLDKLVPCPGYDFIFSTIFVSPIFLKIMNGYFYLRQKINFILFSCIQKYLLNVVELVILSYCFVRPFASNHWYFYLCIYSSQSTVCCSLWHAIPNDLRGLFTKVKLFFDLYRRYGWWSTSQKITHLILGSLKGHNRIRLAWINLKIHTLLNMKYWCFTKINFDIVSSTYSKNQWLVWYVLQIPNNNAKIQCKERTKDILVVKSLWNPVTKR